MTDTKTVPRDSDREPASKPPPVDESLADELLGRAQAEGATRKRKRCEQIWILPRTVGIRFVSEGGFGHLYVALVHIKGLMR